MVEPLFSVDDLERAERKCHVSMSPLTIDCGPAIPSWSGQLLDLGLQQAQHLLPYPVRKGIQTRCYGNNAEVLRSNEAAHRTWNEVLMS